MQPTGVQPVSTVSPQDLPPGNVQRAKGLTPFPLLNNNI